MLFIYVYINVIYIIYAYKLILMRLLGGVVTIRGVATGISMWKHLIICQCTGGGGMGIVKLPLAVQQAAGGRGARCKPPAG